MSTAYCQVSIMSRTKKLKALNPLIREDIFVLDSIFDITTRLKRSCSIEDGILLVYLGI